jgi:hypothetical protein
MNFDTYSNQSLLSPSILSATVAYSMSVIVPRVVDAKARPRI